MEILILLVALGTLIDWLRGSDTPNSITNEQMDVLHGGE